MQTLTFQNITLTPAKVDNQIWLTSGELAKALDYASTQSVTKIYERNADEFTSSMTTIAEVKTNGGIQKMRIFSLRGCHLIAMFARTKVAKEFRGWVLDILDKEVGQPVQVSPKLSDSQCHQIQKAVRQKCKDNSTHYQTIYTALKDKFKVPSYKDILASEFDEALAFIVGFEFVPNYNLALIQNILADADHQTKKARDEFDQIMIAVHHILEHMQNLQIRLDIGERNIGALRTRFIA